MDTFSFSGLQTFGNVFLFALEICFASQIQRVGSQKGILIMWRVEIEEIQQAMIIYWLNRFHWVCDKNGNK